MTAAIKDNFEKSIEVKKHLASYIWLLEEWEAKSFNSVSLLYAAQFHYKKI